MTVIPIPIAVVGVGKIARDQHLPSIAASDRFTLAGAVSRHATDLDVPVRGTLTELKALCPELRAVAVCTPPRGRAALVAEACSLGLDVMLEKPPAATLGEAEGFAATAAAAGRTLFLAWHSRAAAGVAPARAWLAGRRIDAVRVDWLEDARVWHPGQEWIWEPGIGVFDPGINALSILTRILPFPVTLTYSRLDFPVGRRAPIAAALTLAGRGGEPVAIRFSFDQRGPQTWAIAVDTDRGRLELHDGGARLRIDGIDQMLDASGEYPELYARFAELIDMRQSDADLTPFRLVADAFLIGERREVAAFDWD